jgi:transforming growth factor-beta-induced protein
MKLNRLMIAVGLMATAALSFGKQNKDIVDTAVGAGSFKTLVKLVGDAGLVQTLKGKGPFTVFAPTDEAFAKLPKALVERITGDKKLLTQVLTYHVVAGNVRSTDLSNGLKAKTVQGETLLVTIKGNKVMFNKSNLIKADIGTSNGVIHVIDTVLLPPSIAKMVSKHDWNSYSASSKSCNGGK